MSRSRDEECQLLADIMTFLHDEGHEHLLMEVCVGLELGHGDSPEVADALMRLVKWEWVYRSVDRYMITDQGIVLYRMMINAAVSVTP